MIGMANPQEQICWLTADYFVDCDIDIIKNISKIYKVHWHIVLHKKNSRYAVSEISKFGNTNTKISLHISSYRLRNPLCFVFYFRLMRKIKNTPHKILYLNYTPSLFFSLAAFLVLKKNNVIVTAHQGKVHDGFKFKSIYRLTYDLFYSYFSCVHMFSNSESDKFREIYPNSTIFTIPLVLKNFGECEVNQDQDRIIFFNFGEIRPSKNIGLLIEAACGLYEDGITGFCVTIAGDCENWEIYESKIRYPEIFNLMIRKIGNQEVCEIFRRGHYLILPYSIVTQSGPLKIAYNYNVPVIASNLPGLSSEILDSKTGFLFEPDNLEELKSVMLKAINISSQEYQIMKQNLAEFVERKYSNEKIAEKYLTMFNSINPKH